MKTWFSIPHRRLLEDLILAYHMLHLSLLETFFVRRSLRVLIGIINTSLPRFEDIRQKCFICSSSSSTWLIRFNLLLIFTIDVNASWSLAVVMCCYLTNKMHLHMRIYTHILRIKSLAMSFWSWCRHIEKKPLQWVLICQMFHNSDSICPARTGICSFIRSFKHLVLQEETNL